MEKVFIYSCSSCRVMALAPIRASDHLFSETEPCNGAILESVYAKVPGLTTDLGPSR